MVNDVLKSVNLTVAGDRKAGGYSGGMKRRLSVANSLIGDPTVVYMGTLPNTFNTYAY